MSVLATSAVDLKTLLAVQDLLWASSPKTPANVRTGTVISIQRMMRRLEFGPEGRHARLSRTAQKPANCRLDEGKRSGTRQVAGNVVAVKANERQELLHDDQMLKENCRQERGLAGCGEEQGKHQDQDQMK